ncbi:MAG: hypothetical protein KatS3mg027_1748 [Bacteroidia bacterium]|nr:MAG: hypothetical protein KatS3mg027_1748 [Bacteroidia bacterium]
MIKLSFIKESLVFTIGNALPVLASVILLPFYANLLSSSNYVALSFYIGISLLYQILFSFSFEQYYGVIFTENKDDANKIKVLNGSTLLYLIVQGIIIILLSLLIGDSLFKIIFTEKSIEVHFYPYGLISILTGFLNALFKVSCAPFIYSQSAKLFFSTNIINFFATLCLSLSGLYVYPDSLNGPIYGRFFSGLIIVLFNLILLHNQIEWNIEWKFIKEYIHKSWALFAYSIVNWITGNIDRYFLKSYIDVNELASYDLIMKCFIGIEFIQNGLGIAIIAKIFDDWKKNNTISLNTNAGKYSQGFVISIFLSILVFILILPFFIKLIIHEQYYYSGFKYLPLIASAYIIRSISYPYYFAFLYAKKTHKMFQLNFLTIIFQILLSWWFIPIGGLASAVFISIASKFIQIILYHLSFQNFIYCKFKKTMAGNIYSSHFISNPFIFCIEFEYFLKQCIIFLYFDFSYNYLLL